MSKLSVKKMIEKNEILMAEGKNEKKKVRIGCDFGESKTIKTFKNEIIYIPGSEYCFVKCLEKLHNIEIPRNKLKPYGDSLKKLRELLPKKCVMPDIIRIRTKYIENKSSSSSDDSDVSDSSEDSKKQLSYLFETIGKNPLKKLGYFILLVELHSGEFHAILVNESGIKEFKNKVNRPQAGYLRVYKEIKNNMVIINKVIKKIEPISESDSSEADMWNDESSDDEKVIINSLTEEKKDTTPNQPNNGINFIFNNEGEIFYIYDDRFYIFDGLDNSIEIDKHEVGEYVNLISLDGEKNCVMTLNQLKYIYEILMVPNAQSKIKVKKIITV